MDLENELTGKMLSYVATKFGGNNRACFDWYDRDGDGKIDAGELRLLLLEARVAPPLLIRAWVQGVMVRLDKDGDSKISWAEFESVIPQDH